MNNRLINDNWYLDLDDKYSFLVISKNGCTTLKRLSISNYTQEQKNKVYERFNVNFDRIDLNHFNSIHAISPLFNHKGNNKVKFFVYRDPVDRLVSVFNNRKIQQGRDFQNINNFEKFLHWTSKELQKSRYKDIDEHIRPQYMYFEGVSKPDFYVNLNELDQFLDYIGYPNVSKFNVSDTHEIISDTQKEIIRLLYKKDYKLPLLYPDYKEYFNEKNM